MIITRQLTVEFGLIKDYPETTIYYDGDDDIGITITIEATDGISDLRIDNVTYGNYIKINGTLEQYDVVTINTAKGKKSAMLKRGGLDYSILNNIVSSDEWIHLEKGQNVFTYSASSGVGNVKIYIDFRNRFNGV